jgi:hypothetical protein
MGIMGKRFVSDFSFEVSMIREYDGRQVPRHLRMVV